MVQAAGIQSMQSGTVIRTGKTQDNRVVYSIIGDDGMAAGRISLPEQDCDKFEKSYNTLIKTAPQMQKIAQKYSDPEEVKRVNKKVKWTIGIGTGIGFVIPAALISNGSIYKKIGFTLLGTVAGFFTSGFIARKMAEPKGAKEFTQAVENISKMDIRPLDNTIAQA